MFNKETKAKEAVDFTFKKGVSIIWKLASYGIAIDIFAALAAIPVVAVMLLFTPDKLQNALEIINTVFN